MKTFYGRPSRLILAILATIAITGCGAAQGPFSPSASGPSNLSGHARPLDASTEVDISNDWTASIAGTAPSSLCWSISPGLPIVGAGDIAGPVTITYKASTTCPIPASIGVTYGPAAFTGPQCRFNVIYDVHFTFTVTQSALTACRILYPPYGVDAIFVYAQGTSGSSHVMHPVRLH